MESLSFLYSALSYAELTPRADVAVPCQGLHRWLWLKAVAAGMAVSCLVAQAGLPVRAVVPDKMAVAPGQPASCQGDRPPLLQPGDRGDRVRQLQQQLRAAGFYSGSISGSFGPQTEAAVRRFQAVRGLAVDGLVGPATRAALASPNPPPAASASTVPQRWQQYLQALGYYQPAASGDDAAALRDAVRRFQAARGLAVDGIIGPATSRALAGALAPELVRDLQTRLQRGGFYTGAIDGIWGPRTQAAVAAARDIYGVSVADLAGNRY